MADDPLTPETTAPGNDRAGTCGTAAPATKTPLFQAIHASRYQRQALIRSIQERYGQRLICYVSGINCSIDRDDIVPFVDVLHNISANENLDLLLHTGGGDIDAAEKLITMLRNKVGDKMLRIIVPDFAKSAGTLLVLGADYVVMSDTSELGPIDPQIILADSNGNAIAHSVQCYLDAYDEHAETLRKDPGCVSAKIMLSKLDPATVKLFQAVNSRARQFAEKHLLRGMFRKGGNATLAASRLLDTKQWLSHSQMISWEDARDPRLDLHVKYMDPKSAEWQDYWQLYCLQRLTAGDRHKLYESDCASLVLDGLAP